MQHNLNSELQRILTPYLVTCFYMSSDLPSSKLLSEYTIAGVVKEGINYFSSWALFIQRLEIRDCNGLEIMHIEEITPKNTPIEVLEKNLFLKDRFRARPFNGNYLYSHTHLQSNLPDNIRQ